MELDITPIPSQLTASRRLSRPKPSLVDVLHDYSLASERGADGGDCAAAYAACPMSLLTLMKAGQGQQEYEQAIAARQVSQWERSLSAVDGGDRRSE